MNSLIERMVDIPLSQLLIACVSAITVHSASISREPDFHVAALAGTYLATLAITAFAMYSVTADVSSTILQTIVLATVFNATLTASILVHRGFLHRLRRFPGPWQARLSNVWNTLDKLKKADGHLKIQSLHEKYGDVVRVGPRHLSIRHRDAVAPLYGPSSVCRRAPFYEMFGIPALLQTRDKREHTARRKAWDKSFTGSQLAVFGSAIEASANLLMSQLRKSAGQSVNMSHWGKCYGWDIMGEVGLGRNYGMLKTGKLHKAVQELDDASPAFYLGVHAAWVFRLMLMIPGAGDVTKSFFEMAGQEMEKNIKNFNREEAPKDIASMLLRDPIYGLGGPQFSRKSTDFSGESIISAGSDTVSSTLPNAIYFLATHPKALKKLRSELDAAFPGGPSRYGPADAISGSIPYLEAVINETLRLLPPVSVALPRETPAEGLTIGDTYIPGNVIVGVPTYSIHRDARYFERPTEFIPERWTDESPELTKDKRVFMPFTIGPYTCPGKRLAYVELRMAVARIVMNFDIELAEGMSAEGYMDGVQEYFISQYVDLWVELTPRG